MVYKNLVPTSEGTVRLADAIWRSEWPFYQKKHVNMMCGKECFDNAAGSTYICHWSEHL
jgi:hypothetical protein